MYITWELMKEETNRGTGNPNQSIGQSEIESQKRVELEEAYTQFVKLAISELGFTEWTRRNYGTIFRRLIQYAKEKGMIYLEQLTKEDIRQFGERWENLASRRQMITRIKAILEILVSEGFIEKNPAATIRTRGNIQKRLIGADEWLTFDEANRLIAACRNIEERATILFALRTGVRKESLIKNQRRPIEVYMENKRAKVFEKQQKERIVYFNGEVHDTLKQLFIQGKTFPCFTDDELYARLAQLRRIAGIQKKVTPLALRHSFACHCRLKEMKLEDLRDLMGHESIQTTLIYANVGATEQQKAYEKVWGERKAWVPRIAV